MLKQLSIVVFSCCLVACAAAPEGAPRADRTNLPQGSDCIFEGTVRDYRVLDESNLVVTASARRKYHIELARRAYGLRSSWHIGFSSPTNSICAGFSELVVDGGFGPEGIRIRSIRALNDEELDALLVLFGKKEPEIEQTPAAEEVETAEVEELD